MTELAELVINSASPGSQIAASTLNVKATASTTTLTLAVGLSSHYVAAEAQMRCRIGTEIMRVRAPTSAGQTTLTVLERGAENTKAEAHEVRAEVFLGELTAAGLAKVGGSQLAPLPSGGDDTAALIAALAEVKQLRLREGTYKTSSEITLPEGKEIIGCGRQGTTIVYSGIGTAFSLGSEGRMTNVTIEGTASKYTLLALKGTFSAQLRAVVLRGTNAEGSIKAEQQGVVFSENAGNTVFDQCNFQNLGVAVLANTQVNYIIGCMFQTNNKSILSNAGSYAAGMVIFGCTFTSNLGGGATTSFIEVLVNTNEWRIGGCWFEGGKKAIVLGSSTEGPDQVSIKDCFVAATTTCIQISKGCGEVILDGVRFGKEESGTPTELEIKNEFGQARGLLSAQKFDFAASEFPTKWQYFSARGTVKLAGVVAGPEEWSEPQHIKSTAKKSPGLIVETPTAMETYLFEVKETGEEPSFYVDQNATAHAAGLISGAAGIAVVKGLGVWNHSQPASQPASIKPEAVTVKEAMERIDKVLKEYGLTA